MKQQPGRGITVCWKYPDGKNGFCLHLPGGAILSPTTPRQALPVGENPGVYNEFLADALTVSHVFSAIQGVADEATRQALQSGVESAVQALHTHVSPHGLSVSLHK